MIWPKHGANPQLLYKGVGIDQPENILDYSVNTNPFGSPFHLCDYQELVEVAMKQYPEPNAPRLKQIISSREQLAMDQLLIGNGGSECIFLLANYFRGKNVCIIEPTFGEYRAACTAFNCRLESYVLKEENNWNFNLDELTNYIAANDVLFICHPNNPTGTIYEQQDLLEIIEIARLHHTFCVIDEAFYDFCNESIKLSNFIHDYPNLIILRSLTKMYGIPGLRLGYIIANEQIIKQLGQYQPPWSVNGVAQVIGEIALNNREFVAMTKSNVESARTRLLKQLQQLGYYVTPSKVNFFLLREKERRNDTSNLIDFLLNNGIVPRHTFNFIGLDGNYIRLCIKTDEENAKLVEVLTRWKKQC